MTRRAFGINLDDGVALTTEEDFAQLYVAARPDELQRLQAWLSDPAAESLVLAGQIGCGKTTLLNDALRSAPEHPVIQVGFDQWPLDETPGAFLAILFGSLLKKSRELGCSCEGLGVALSDFGEPASGDWGTLQDLLLLPSDSLVGASRVRKIYVAFGDNAAQGRKACASLLDRIERALGGAPSIIAEGVDKFAISAPGYMGLVETLEFLHRYKTLFEANAAHLFDSGRSWVTSDKLFIRPLSAECIVSMCERRLGSHAPLFRDALPLLSQYAGGNARQALRLLNAYYFYRTQRGNDRNAALAMTAHRVTQDLLQFGFKRFPRDMLAILKRDGYVEASVLTNPATAQEARDILYRNWAFLAASPEPASTRWPVVINPLVSDAVKWERSTPEPPELTLARRWAQEHHMSPMGLGAPDDGEQRPVPWERVWTEMEILSSPASKDSLNVVRLLEEVASSLFSTDRQDRILVSYREPTHLSVALDYLVGKAATYGPFTCRQIDLNGGDGCDPITELLTQIGGDPETTIFAVFLDAAWQPAQLEDLDRLRDRFAQLQMIWWVPHDAVLRYLSHWPQFRQLFRFYVLEDDFLRTLSQEEIEEDLAVLHDLAGPEDQGIGRLGCVLAYLESRRRPT